MAKHPKASIGVALIAKDAERTLPACLQSLRPYVRQVVIGVDERTTDKTAKVAKRYGADVVVPIVVSEWHECERHGRVLAQHFARARNQSFAHLDPSLDWWLWLDADDVLKGGEHLAALCQQWLDSPAVGVWWPYHYATVNEHATNTLFHRERLLRTKLPDGTPITWEWQHRVHEVVAPVGVPQPRWALDDTIAVYHQPGAHRSESSAPRNELLLEIDLEEDPTDARAHFYLGNGRFAMGDFAGAVHWYERLSTLPGVEKSHYELWQAYCYLSMAYEKLGDLPSAANAAFAAMGVEPRHPEPYLRLAAVNMLGGEPEKAVFWTKEAARREKPPFFVFKNPLDYSYNAHTVMADALVQMGQVGAALREYEAAYRVVPDEKLAQAIERYRALETAAARATAFAELAQGRSDEEVIALWETLQLPPEVRQFGRCRDLVMPAYLRRRALRTQPRIVFWCGRSMEEWYPGTLNTTGIGGSETAVVEIARRFAADGWRVDVYNGAGRYEGVYDGVGYWEPERLNEPEMADVLVSWRQPRATALPVHSVLRLLWCHDLNYGPEAQDFMDEPTNWHKVLGVSQWHAERLREYYGLDERKVDVVPNGINLDRFGHSVRKVPFQCVYASSPDRGLMRLLELWPALVAREPGTTLHIAYGWDNVDKAIAAGRRDLADLKARIEAKLADTPNVVWRGRLPQDELAKLFSESVAWLYPTHFLEVSCITAMEAMAGGCVPVTSAVGALPETVGDAGVLVPGNPYSAHWKEFYIHLAYSVLCAPEVRKPLQEAGRERAKQLTWDASYARWKAIVEGLLSGKKELVGVA